MKKSSKNIRPGNKKRRIITIGEILFAILIILPSVWLLISPMFANAQSSDTDNPNKSAFRLTVCDGPTLPLNMPKPNGYVACDFSGLMKQVQKLITVAIVIGVLAAVLGFTYAGILYMSGDPGKIKKARDIFPKIFGGFIIMLSAWFIVYELLRWLTGSGSGFSSLLGNP